MKGKEWMVSETRCQGKGLLLAALVVGHVQSDRILVGMTDVRIEKKTEEMTLMPHLTLKIKKVERILRMQRKMKERMQKAKKCREAGEVSLMLVTAHSVNLFVIQLRYQGNQGGRKSGFYCTVCECEFGGSFLTHRRTKEHKKARDKKFPRCGLCFKTFNDPVDYKKHEKTEEHKKRLVQYAIKKELFGSDDDVFISIDASRFFEEEKEKENEKQQELEKDKSKENTEEKEEQKASEAKDENAEVEKGEENPENEEEKTEEKEVEPVGQTYVVEINGYFCKVCHKFYKDENIAKVSHCKSKMHHERHEKLLIAIEKKEARKKAAEEANRREEEEAKRREEEAKQREEEEAKRREEEEAKQREEEEAKEEEEEAKRKGRKKKLSRGRQKKLLLEKKKKKRMVKKKKLKKLTKKNKLLKILI
ncbi:uncharacterized protein LOC143230749 isoform X2 [Tachypleus tridentatus]|uniref:uncharacterized protein LOC143230749 isoform X2 n=1 Tax=Tachypleus tridentatus TaxID=6853 RepID=UPI003FD123FA